MKTPTPPCHSGFPGVVRGTADPSASLRDDKKERVIAGKGRLLDERAVTLQAFFKSNLDNFSRPCGTRFKNRVFTQPLHLVYR
jgi:hypothetical protein